MWECRVREQLHLDMPGAGEWLGTEAFSQQEQGSTESALKLEHP